ncbi:MAG TPA: hypothetical protein PK636_08725, partial [bacterium]|nr:hypothetical protein [bacterium]
MNKILKTVALLPYGRVYCRSRRFLEKSQWWKPEDLARYRSGKIEALIRHAWDRVPSYREAMERDGIEAADIRSVVDLARLPVLSKEQVNENFARLVAADFPDRLMLLYSTGGSSGLPTRFYHDAREMAWTEAAVNRSYSWAGYRTLEKFLLVSGLPAEKHSVISLLRRLQGQRRISLFGAGKDEIEQSLDYLLRLRPHGLKGYVSWLEILAGALKKRGGPAVWRPAHVITSSEKLTPRSREILRRGFGSEPFENYSSREFMLAAECPKHRGLHIAAENVVIETARDGVPVAPGEWG